MTLQVRQRGDVRVVLSHSNPGVGDAVVDGEGSPAGPSEIDKNRDPWQETRTYRVWFKCPKNGQTYHNTVIAQSNYLQLPDNPTEQQIRDFNTALEKQEESDQAEINFALGGLKIKCDEWSPPSPADKKRGEWGWGDR